MTTVAAVLELIPEFWSEVGFVPWSWKGLAGVFRRVTFRKDSLLGEVACYYADDYIVWKYDIESAGDYILANWRPVTDVMSHRFLVIGEENWARPRSRSFFLGIKGWVDVLSYKLDSKGNSKFQDLIFLVNKCNEFAQKEVKKNYPCNSGRR